MRVLIAGVVAVMGLVLAPSASAGGSRVTYEVVSNGPLLSVVYFDGMNDQKILNNQDAPWSASLTTAATYPLFGVTAQTTGTQVSCRITVDGQVRDQKSGTGRYSLAVCSAI